VIGPRAREPRPHAIPKRIRRRPKPEDRLTLKNLDRRLANIEQILPTLATREEMRAEAVETRRHFDVVFESMRAEIRVFAEGQGFMC